MLHRLNRRGIYQSNSDTLGVSRSPALSMIHSITTESGGNADTEQLLQQQNVSTEQPESPGTAVHARSQAASDIEQHSFDDDDEELDDADETNDADYEYDNQDAEFDDEDIDIDDEIAADAVDEDVDIDDFEGSDGTDRADLTTEGNDSRQHPRNTLQDAPWSNDLYDRIPYLTERDLVTLLFNRQNEFEDLEEFMTRILQVIPSSAGQRARWPATLTRFNRSGTANRNGNATESLTADAKAAIIAANTEKKAYAKEIRRKLQTSDEAALRRSGLSSSERYSARNPSLYVRSSLLRMRNNSNPYIIRV